MVFLQYARDMAPKSLYESLTVTSKSRLTGEAVFRETVHRDNFIEDDYGLKTSNNITDHFKSIIEGTKAFEHRPRRLRPRHLMHRPGFMSAMSCISA